MKWLDRDLAVDWAVGGTDAYRIASDAETRIERFGSGVIISYGGTRDPEGLLNDLERWAENAGITFSQIYFRRLVNAPGRDDTPRLVRGTGDPVVIARENGFAYEVDFEAGYSCGLFPDQRANREVLVGLQAGKVLNTFAYTCAFSVAAAAGGAETMSLDLAKVSLIRGRRNFAINHLSLTGHRFIADDVFDVLPRLARRGEKFDAIILDPPTFSRGQKGRIFRAEKDYGRLVELAAACALPGAWMLLSTNCTSLDVASLRQIARKSVPGNLQFKPSPSQPDVPAGQGSSTVWVRLP